MTLKCDHRQLACISFIIVTCIAVFAGVFGSWKANASSVPVIDLASPPANGTGSTPAIEVRLKITSFAIGSDLGVAVQIIDNDVSELSTYPDIADDKGKLNQNVWVSVGGENYLFKAGSDISQKWTPTIPLDESNIQLYPLDYYKASLPVNILCPDKTAVNGDPRTDCDLAVTIKTRSIPSYDYKFDITPPKDWEKDWGSRDIILTINRANLVYQGFLFVAFWVIMLIEIALMILYTVCDAKLETAILGLTNGFMFALPAIRNSAPFNPPLGTTLDYAAFYWAMLVAVFAFVVVGVKYILGLIQSLPAPKKVEPEKKVEEKKPEGSAKTDASTPVVDMVTHQVVIVSADAGTGKER